MRRDGGVFAPPMRHECKSIGAYMLKSAGQHFAGNIIK